MGYSVKVIQQSERQDGTASIVLRVIVNRKKKHLPLEITWPVKFFSAAGVCMPRYANDTEAADRNLIIGKAMADANEIFTHFRLSGQPISIERFTKRWGREISRQSFTRYMAVRIRERLKEKEIEHSTYKAHLKTLVKLEAFKKDVGFCDLDDNWAFEFDSFLKRHIVSRIGDTTNTRWAHHKTIKTYLAEARKKDKILFHNPYDFFSISMVEGTWRPLYERDIEKLWKFYNSERNQEKYRQAAARFLFIVWTGLRVSDLNRVTSEWNFDGVLKFTAHKTRKDNIYVQVPLIEPAQQIFDWAKDQCRPGRPIFRWFEEQTCNDYLKKVAELCGIRQNLHHHIGRHTFITQLLKHGAGLEMAQEFAGHRDIKTTKKYDHPDDEKRFNRIQVLNNTINAKSPTGAGL